MVNSGWLNLARSGRIDLRFVQREIELQVRCKIAFFVAVFGGGVNPERLGVAQLAKRTKDLTNISIAYPYQ